VLFTVENTDPKCYWLTNYIEVRDMAVTGSNGPQLPYGFYYVYGSANRA